MIKNRILKPTYICIELDCNKKVWKKNSRCLSCFCNFRLEKRIEIKCLQCNKSVRIKPYRKNIAKYCSDKCRMKGLSENNRDKKRLDISLRTTGNKNPMFGNPRLDLQKKFKGRGNPRYIDGRTSLTVRIRGLLEYKTWRKEILERDDYTCQDCKQIGKYLEVHHHKEEFYILLSEFLKHYDQFSPIEDKETLVRLAMKWQPFWDINKGEALCKDCHKYKTFKNKK